MPGLTIREKDSSMSHKMSEFITDAIIIAKVKNAGVMSKMAEAINEKLEENFGGSWTVIVMKSDHGGWAMNGIPSMKGTYIEVDHGAHTYVIFKNQK